jgi:hypothetical protein
VSGTRFVIHAAMVGSIALGVLVGVLVFRLLGGG